MVCYTKHIFLVQLNFQLYKCKIRVLIIFLTNEKHYKMIYYFKYYYELNDIEHFWYSAKKWA